MGEPRLVGSPTHPAVQAPPQVKYLISPSWASVDVVLCSYRSLVLNQIFPKSPDDVVTPSHSTRRNTVAMSRCPSNVLFATPIFCDRATRSNQPSEVRDFFIVSDLPHFAIQGDPIGCPPAKQYFSSQCHPPGATKRTSYQVWRPPPIGVDSSREKASREKASRDAAAGVVDNSRFLAG